MISFVLSVVALVLGYLLYGRFIAKPSQNLSHLISIVDCTGERADALIIVITNA